MVIRNDKEYYLLLRNTEKICAVCLLTSTIDHFGQLLNPRSIYYDGRIKSESEPGQHIMRQYRCIVGPYRVTGVCHPESTGALLTGEYLDTGLKVAIRDIRVKASKLDATRSRIVRELNIIKSSPSHFTLRLFDVIEEPGHIFLITERANGNLRERINRCGPLRGEEAKRVITQLVSMVDFLHRELKICHRNIRAETILFDRHNNIRITGFGLAQQLLTPNQTFTAVPESSPEGVAPEMAQRKPCTKEIDIWALGCVIYFLTVGRRPFQDIAVQNELQKIVFNEPVFPDDMDDLLLDLIQKMLQKDPERRIKSYDLLKHPYFCDFDFGKLSKTASIEEKRVDEALSARGVSDLKDLTARAIATRELEIDDRQDVGSIMPVQDTSNVWNVAKEPRRESHEAMTTPMMILARSVMTRKGLVIRQLASTGLTDADSDRASGIKLKQCESS